MKLDTQEQMAQIYPDAIDRLKELDINAQEDEFMIVQPFDDGNVVILEVEEDDDSGDRTIKQKVYDACVVLPAKEGTLDIFV